eukprot:14216658-Alexandrium_andersonii.AAC.1
MHPSGASGTKFEAPLGPAQFKVRTPESIVHVRRKTGTRFGRFGLRRLRFRRSIRFDRYPVA